MATATRRFEVSTTTMDRIEKELILKAPPERVWKAIANAREFGQWFGVELAGEFVPGARVEGKILHEKYRHAQYQMIIEAMDAPRLFSYRWHPYAIEPGVDYSTEPTTLIEFRLEKVAEGTRLTVVESGFDRIPLERRAEAFRMNEGGWTSQLRNIARHLGEAA